MAELLSKWINQDVGLSIPVQSFERDFSNGYYLGELLCKLSLLDSSTLSHFACSSHPHALTANWGFLGAALRNQGIQWDAAQAQDIMHAKAGAALKLIYQIKMAVQRKEQAQAQQALFSAGSPSSKSKTTASLPSIAGAAERSPGSALGFSSTLGGPGATAAFTSPKGHQAARPFDRMEQRRLAENLLHLSHANKKEKHMEIHLAPFAKAAASAEEKVREEQLREEEARAQSLRASQVAAREKLATNMAYTRSWNSGGMHIWRDNMERIDATKASRKQWAAKQDTKAAQEAYLRGREKQHEVATGIDAFEKNLERIGGANSAAGAKGAASAQSEAEEGGYGTNYSGPGGEASAVQQMSVKLASSLGSPAQLAKQSAEHMARIHDKVASDALARKERDRRRRRVLVEQGAQSSALEEANRAELFLEKLSKECAEERALGEEVWRTNQLYEVIKSNTAYREQQEARVREEQQRRIVAQQASHYASLKADHERALAAELARFQEVRLEQEALQHEANTAYAQQLVGRIVDVAHKAVCFRAVSEQALIPPPMWREWMSLFVQGMPLLPESAEGDDDRSLESLHPGAAGSAGSASAASLGMDLESSLPSSLLSAMVPARPRTSAMGAATPKTPSGASKAKEGAAAGKPGSAAAIAAAAAAQAEFDSQSLSTDAFYSSLQLNREVSRLMSSLRDVNPSTAELVDAQALEDYLEARNEWSYDIKEVAPPELVNAQKTAAVGSPTAAAAAVAAASASLTTTPRSRSRPGSSASSTAGGSKKNLLGSSPEPSEEGSKKLSSGGGSKKAKELAAAAAAAAAAEAAASGHQPFTSLSFLPPLHPADTFDLSEPLPPADAPCASSFVTPASHNPLFGALLQRIVDVASGKESPPDLPDVPRFPLAIAVLGKPYSGRSVQSAALSEKYGLAVLRTEQLVTEAVAELDVLEAAPTGPGGEKLSARAEKKAAAAAAAAASGSDSPAGRKSSGGKVVKSAYHQLLLRMKKQLSKSEPLADDIVVGIIVEAIRRLPERVAIAKLAATQAREQRIRDATDPDSGEIMDESVRAMIMSEEDSPSIVAGEGGYVLLGFPSTAAQARLLEQALSGFEPPKPVTSKSTGAPRLGKTKAGSGGKDAKLSSKIARAPTPPPQQGVYPSGLHLVLRLEQDNEVLLRRALGRRVDPLTNRPFHLDYAQPTEADMHPAASAASAAAPISKADALTLKSRLQPIASEVDYHARLPELFLNYEAEQPALEEWFALFGTLHSIPGRSADQQPLSIDAVRESIREIVRAKMEELDVKAVEDEAARAEAERAAAIAAGEIVPPPQHPLEAALVDAPNRAAAEAWAIQQAALAAEEAAQPTSPPPARKLGLGGDSKKDAASSKDKDRAADGAADSDQLVSAATYPVLTGAEFYSFASSGFFDLSLSSFLLSKWELCESNFIRQSKHAFRALRAIRAQNLEYFASTRRNFFAFLRRADAKSNVLQTFQTAFNSLPQDLRADPATKDELHMRLDELGESLWRLNAAKHEENEAEFARIVCGGNTHSLTPGAPPNGFLEAQGQAFFFYYALLLQLELDRYLQVVKIAQDFFANAKGCVIHEEKFERDEKMEKKRAAAAAAAAASAGSAASAAPGAEGETSRGSAASSSAALALSEPRGGLGLKLHINLPLRQSLGDPKVRAAKKKELEAAQKKKDAASGATAASSSSSAAPSASASSASLGAGKDGAKKSKGGALPSARKRFSASSSSSVLAYDQLNGEEDPFSEIVELIRANLVSPEEALEQFSSNTDLESMLASVAGAAGTSRGGAKSGKRPAAGAAAAGGANKAPGTPATAAAGAAARGASAGKKRGGKGGALVPVSSGPPRPASRDALLDAQFRALLTRENQILSARIRRIHRNAHLELSQLKYYNEKTFLPKLDAYLELRIRGESGAIDSLMYHIRGKIEEGKVLQQALRLEGENAFIDQDVLALPAPESLVPTFVSGFSDLFDPLYATRLTYAQLIHVANTLRSLSVGGSGGLDVKAAEVYALLLSQFHATHTAGASGGASSFYPIAGEQNLPLKWSPAVIAAAAADSSALASHSSSMASLPVAQSAIGAGSSASTRGVLATGSVQAYFKSLVGMFAGGSGSTPAPASSGQPSFKLAYIDYRDLLVSCALLDSVATPSINQLRSMQALYALADTDRDGAVSWDEFASVPLWFESGPTGDEGHLSAAQKQEKADSDRRTVEPIKRLKEFFFHLFATEMERPSEAGPIQRTFLLPSLDFLLYLCFDDDGGGAAPEAAQGAAASGQEKAALLCGQQQQAQWSAITQAFVQRYVAQTKQRTSAASTTAALKFQRKDLTKAAQAQASA